MNRSEPPSHGVSGESGRRPRIEDVATKVGLSTASVSLALSDRPGPSQATRRRVREAAEALGYRPNRNASLLARRRTRLLGVMMNVHNSFHAALVDDLYRVSEMIGYDIVLSTVTSTRSEERATETLLDNRCEALLLLGPVAPTVQLVALDERVPVVVVGRRIPGARLDVVRGADDKGVKLAVDHLVGLGHRRIAFIDGGRDAIATLRRRGYRTAMRRNGLADEQWVIAGDHTEESGIAAGLAILGSPHPPTAVVCHNDRSAVGCYDAMLRAKVPVPKRLSLIGYDDSPLARLAHVNLTTVNQSTAPMAENAVRVAVERLEEQRPGGTELVLEPYLVVRATTARLRRPSHPRTSTPR